MRFACIGSRELTPEQITVCEKLGKWIVQCGHELHSGNAKGADQAFARGGNTVCTAQVHLHLPWDKYEYQARAEGNMLHPVDTLPEEMYLKYERLAEEHHPAWNRLGQGVRKLMVRNVSILLPPTAQTPVDFCLAIPSDKQGGGGTGHGMRISGSAGIRLINLHDTIREGQLHELCEAIRNEGSNQEGTS